MNEITDGGKSNGHDRLTRTYDQAAGVLAKANESALGFIRERPVVALLGALALGFAVARLARRGER